jgi:pyroglutamyl-peptidase
MAAQRILLTGFAPFGGEKVNPSWEVAKLLDGRSFGEATVYTKHLPVDCKRAAHVVMDEIARTRPAAVLGLGQAGGRPVLSLEQIAINLVDSRRSQESIGGLDGRPVIVGAPDAYFSRLPLKSIVALLRRNRIPAGLSLSAGIYACNAVMYTALHTLRRRPGLPVGFIHLPYETAQVARRATPSMSVDVMVAGVQLALQAISRRI